MKNKKTADTQILKKCVKLFIINNMRQLKKVRFTIIEVHLFQSTTY